VVVVVAAAGAAGVLRHPELAAVAVAAAGEAGVQSQSH